MDQSNVPNAASAATPTPNTSGQLATTSPFRELALTDTTAAAGRILTSYDVSTDAGKIGLFRSRQDAEGSAADMRAGIEVEHVTIHPVQLVSQDQDGEVIDAVRTVLVSPDGTRYACVSNGVAKSIGEMAAIFGPPPWRPARRVKLIEVQTRMGRRMYQLDLA